ncbi:MAG: tetratricopeptide repeat protein [Candidatus Sumerlaeia bacterium]|nr:tetratricopeptide repeat protein [Candidatus Sumerlaeia bacterium]
MTKRRQRDHQPKKKTSPSEADRPTAPEPPSGVRDFRLRIAAVAVALAVALAYSNSLWCPFIFDDNSSISQNPSIRRLWRLDRVLRPPGGGIPVQGRPLVNLTLAVNWALHGEEEIGYHLFNLAVHIVNALLLLGIVRRTLLLPAFGDRFSLHATDYAAAVALLWGLHPLTTEAVTYVVQRTELLYSMFYLAALYACIRGYTAERGTRWFAAAWGSCLLGMASKEAMATAPVMILLYDRVFVAQSWKELAQRRWRLYAALAATWVLLAGLMMQSGGSRGGTAGFGAGVTAWEYARTQFWGICRYLQLALWPHGQVVDYGTWIARSPAEILPYALILAVLIALTAAAYTRWPWAGYLGTWYFVVLAPTSSVVPVATQTLAEKRAYLPTAAVVALAVFVLSAAGQHFLHRTIADVALRQRRARLLAAISLAAAALALGALTFRRNQDYRSVLSIWDDAVRKRPQNPRAYLNRAGAYQAQRAWEEALADLQSALALNPNESHAYLQMGDIWNARGDRQKALENYTRAIELKPADIEAIMNRGNLFRDLGDADRALADYARAIELRPELPDGYNNRGLLLAQLGRLDEALLHFSKAIAADPYQPGYYSNRANLYNALGRYRDAIRDCERALSLDPGYSDAYINRGNAYGFLGDAARALADYSKAIELDPAALEAYNNRGGLYIHSDRYDLAIADFSKALELNPNYAKAYSNRAVAYFYRKEYDKAWDDVRRAQALGAAVPEELLQRLKEAQPQP